MKDQTALCIALRAAGHTPDEITTMLDGWVWLGDLAGMEVVPVSSYADPEVDDYPSKLGLVLFHRTCKPGWEQPEEGISENGSCYVANLVERAVKARETHACTPFQPSPEHQARVARWADRSSAPPRPVVAEGDPFGVLAGVELRDVPDGQEDEGEPAIKPLTGYDLHVAAKYADGPGCTPVPVDREGWTTDADGKTTWGPDVVPQVDTGEPVAAGSLYADKCAECTTGASCEAAGSCQFEG